jgi:multicomponent Na+:H+ antiporter subunit G
MAAAVDLLSWALLTGGGGFCLIGALGMLRMPDFYTRMHAASVIDTLGAALLLAGMILQAGPSLAAVKLAVIGALLFFTAPAATHALARAARLRGVEPRLAAESSAGGQRSTGNPTTAEGESSKS